MRKTGFISYILHIFSRIIHASLAYFCGTLIIQDVKKLGIGKENNLFVFFLIRMEVIDVLPT